MYEFHETDDGKEAPAPGMGERLKEILDRVQTEDGRDPAPSGGENGSTSPAAEDGGADLWNNAALMEKLPGILSALRPLLSGMRTASLQKGNLSDRDALLLALKPFLSPARQEAIDTILRVSRLGGVIKNLK